MLFQCIFTTLTPPGMNGESSLLEASSLSWYWSFFHPVMSHLCMFLYFLYVCLFPLTSPVRNKCPSLSPSLPQTSPQSALSEPHLLAGTHMHLFSVLSLFWIVVFIYFYRPGGFRCIELLKFFFFKNQLFSAFENPK